MQWLKTKNLKIFLFITIMLILIILIKTIYLTVKYPIMYTDLIVEYSDEFNVEPYLVAAIINVESNYDEQAISNKEARGLMQISPITGKWAGEELLIEDFSLELLFEPKTNIRIGSWYLNRLSKEFNNNMPLVLAAYNGGSGNVRKWLGNSEYSDNGVSLKKIPFKETEDYVEKVLENYDIYKEIYKDSLETLSDKEESYFTLIIHNIKMAFKDLIRGK